MKSDTNMAMILNFLLAFSIYGCNDHMNEPDDLDIQSDPSISATHNIYNLRVVISGSISDEDGKIVLARVLWGDDRKDQLIASEFDDFTISHTYKTPGSYTIGILAVDDESDSTFKEIPIVVNFEETSLAGIKESMFKTKTNEYLILTLNLHTYQENNQEEKFHNIVDVIGKMDIDFIAFQECAQHRNSSRLEGTNLHQDNMALIIANKLKEIYGVEYNISWDWAHYGWDVWEEGVAVMSKHDLIDTDERFISTNTSQTSTSSRKVIYGSYLTEHGKLNLFSTHTHWRTSENDQEQNNQINNVRTMVEEKQELSPDALTFVCGDFNVNPTSENPWSDGYFTMIGNNEYIDTFLEIYPSANDRPAQSEYNTINGSAGRIDYIFMKQNDKINVVDSQIIFKSEIVGVVSDHYGVVTKIAFIN